MWKIIGYGPEVQVPCVPEYVLLEGEGEKRCVLKSDPRPSADQAVPGPLVPLDGSCLFFEGMWVAVEEGGAVTFDAASEREWRSRRSQELIREASSLRGDPVRALGMVQAAGRLQGFDAAGFVRRLQLSKQSPDEDLVDVLRRVRK